MVISNTETQGKIGLKIGGMHSTSTIPRNSGCVRNQKGWGLNVRLEEPGRLELEKALGKNLEGNRKHIKERVQKVFFQNRFQGCWAKIMGWNQVVNERGGRHPKKS